MMKRVCRDCPLPGCGAKYLVRLANHLADVHLLDINQRRKYLQEAKLQPKVKFVVYQTKTDENNDINSSQEQDRVYELTQSRQHKMQTAVKETRGKKSKTSLKPKTKVIKNQNSCGKAKKWFSIH